MRRPVTSLLAASLIAAALAACSGQSGPAESTPAEQSPAAQATTTGEAPEEDASAAEPSPTEDPATSGLVGGASPEDAASIARAAEVMDLGIDVAGLTAVAWNALTFSEYDDGGATISASAQQDSLDALRAWIDAQDWSGWTVQDATEDEPYFTFRWLGGDGTYLGIQDPEGQDGVSFELIYVPAAG